MSSRRDFITLLGSAAAWPLAARAQQPTTLHRVGILWASSPTAHTFRLDALRNGLRELGYEENRDIAFVSPPAPAPIVTPAIRSPPGRRELRERDRERELTFKRGELFPLCLFSEPSLDHAGVWRELTREHARVDVGAILAQAAHDIGDGVVGSSRLSGEAP